MNDKTSIIEAFLFSEGGPIRKTRLMQLTNMNAAELEQTLQELSARLTGGLTLVQNETEAALVIAAGASSAVKEAQRKELGDEIGEAGLEVLSIILYRGPSTRAQIDYIRGVNTSSTMRNLLSRGLIERVGNPLDGREYIYRPTTELMAYLGVKTLTELPDFEKISTELKQFENQSDSFKGDSAENK
jgi:segregation and condensation protein B